MPNNEELVAEMRKCASQLEELANQEIDLSKTASVYNQAPNTERSEYLDGVLKGLGLE